MKKVVLVILGCSIILFTGCKSKGKELECLKVSKDSGINVSSKVNLLYVKDKIKEAKLTVDYDFDGNTYKEQIDLAYNILNEKYSELKKDKGVIFKISKKDNYLGFRITINANKSSDKVSEIGHKVTDKTKYEEAVKQLKSEEYTCK